MEKYTYKGAAERFSVQDAIRAHKEAGIAVVVNDGKDLTVIIEDMELFLPDFIKKQWRRSLN